MLLNPPPGLRLDDPRIAPQAQWSTGLNIRFRLGRLETLGLFGPLRDVPGDQVTLPGTGVYRRIFTSQSQTLGQILAGSNTNLTLIDYDTASLPGTGTRWRTADLTPVGLPAANDVVSNPSTGTVEIPPVWWFADQDDLIVGQRANVTAEPPYSWDRDRTSPAVALAGAPQGAVGGGILNRILVLLGCQSFTDPDPRRFMTIRWSARFNFEDWTPSDLNETGELQLEGGSRIVGGGIVGFGIVAWTDTRMALLVETGDIDTVFARRYVDGGRGLLANNAWCEADGRVWWFDEHRVLNVYDGGRPRQIENPIKYGTIERLSDRETARIYMTPNPEFGEVILHYPGPGGEEVTNQLVYNYLLDAWSVWAVPRSAYGARRSVIRPLAVDTDGKVWQHELDAGLADNYLQGPEPPFPYPLLQGALGDQQFGVQSVPSADVEPIDAFVLTNLVASENITSQTWALTRVLADHLPSPAIGAEDDTFQLVVNGYGEATPVPASGFLTQDWQDVAQGQDAVDLRVAGKALQVGLYMSQIRTVFRFSGFALTSDGAGER